MSEFIKKSEESLEEAQEPLEKLYGAVRKKAREQEAVDRPDNSFYGTYEIADRTGRVERKVTVTMDMGTARRGNWEDKSLDDIVPESDIIPTLELGVVVEGLVPDQSAPYALLTSAYEICAERYSDGSVGPSIEGQMYIRARSAAPSPMYDYRGIMVNHYEINEIDRKFEFFYNEHIDTFESDGIPVSDDQLEQLADFIDQLK